MEEDNILGELGRRGQEVEDLESENRQLRQGVGSMFGGEENENLIKFQLDIGSELNRIKHLLAKDELKIDKDGNETWVACNPKNRLLNDWGINEVMNILTWYLNKNIILSNYSEEEIKIRCHQLSDELSDFIFNNYETMGLDTKDKQKTYPMIVLNLTNTVEASYHRAMAGGERESLRTARMVTQAENLSQFGSVPQSPVQQSRKSFLKPTTWFKT